MKLDQLSILHSFFMAYADIRNFQVTSLKMTRHQKRKIDETHVEVILVDFDMLIDQIWYGLTLFVL